MEQWRVMVEEQQGENAPETQQPAGTASPSERAGMGVWTYRKSGSLKAWNRIAEQSPEPMTYAAAQENPHTLFLLSEL